jgi:phosphopantothenoylcysteine synthetase/decarboxylase
MRAILITAGATRNPIDAMRYISAHSSGRTGAWLGEALSQVGEVTVLGSPEALARCSDGINCCPFGSTADLMDQMHAWVLANPDGVVIHAAAVGDYAVVEADGKIPSGQAELTLTLRPTPKILDAIRGWSEQIRIISFKAAPPGTDYRTLAAIAEAQGRRTDSAVVFANIIGQIDSGVLIWTPEGTQQFSQRTAALGALVSLVNP